MKRITIAAIVMQIFFVCFVDVAGASSVWDSPRSPIQAHQLIFLHVRDEYQLRYAIGGLPQGANSVKANFWTATGTYYETEFENPTGIAYLTCNGTYIFEVLDSSGNTISETRKIITNKIKNPACSSYENGNLKNDLNMTVSDYENGGKEVNIPFNESVSSYDVYHNGEYFQSTDANPYSGIFQSDGLWTFVAKDSNGNIVGSSDFLVGGNDEGLNNPPDGGENGGNDGNGGNGESGEGCDACKWLNDALACPSWDEYMGDLTNAIKDALPPPPDWNEVASTFVNHFSDYFGDVPPPPNKTDIESNIEPPQPTIDTSVPESSMMPQVPEDFNHGPLDTDITNGDVIEIIDESEPFEIYEPNEFIDSDPIGTMVFPNDPRNHSGGIKEPNQIDTGYVQPTPKPAVNDVPKVDMPMPNHIESTIPTPQYNDYVIPIPTIR